jgi:hypothetical protein
VPVAELEQWALRHLAAVRAAAGGGRQAARYTVAERTVAEVLAFARRRAQRPSAGRP